MLCVCTVSTRLFLSAPVVPALCIIFVQYSELHYHFHLCFTSVDYWGSLSFCMELLNLISSAYWALNEFILISMECYSPNFFFFFSKVKTNRLILHNYLILMWYLLPYCTVWLKNSMSSSYCCKIRTKNVNESFRLMADNTQKSSNLNLKNCCWLWSDFIIKRRQGGNAGISSHN